MIIKCILLNILAMEENIKQMNLLFKDALSRMQLMSLSKKSYSFRSGIMCLDDILKNFYAGTLVTIGGMSSMGKTTFALNLVNEFAIKQHHPLLFFGRNIFILDK